MARGAIMGNIILLIASILIYAYFGITNLIYIGISALSTYYAALFISKENDKKKKKIIFLLTISINVLIFIFFKIVNYNNFFNLINPTSILVPIGVSYYTFQVLGYLIDVYKEKYAPESSLYKYALFVMYIPYLFMGPINRYDQIKNTLYNKRKITLENTLNGCIRIMWGLFKKLVIGGRITIIIGTITSNGYTGSYVLLVTLLYSILLYCDFSGGIDIVLGVSKILNIELNENFDRPYFTENVKEFWHHWHMSLSSWLKDYIYIPLGGNRVSKLRTKINIIITFIISGLWHGINYFLWGLIHGLIVAFQHKPNHKHKVLKYILNYLVISCLWIFFVYPTSSEAIKMFTTIFTNLNIIKVLINITNLGINLTNLIVLITSIIILWLVDLKLEIVREKIKKITEEKKIIIIGVLILIVLVFGIYGIGFNSSDFIYSKF